MIGFIYAIQVGHSGPVKIGFTVDLERRFNTLQSASPWPLRVIASVPANKLSEPWIHGQLSAYRIGGEWFRWTPPVKSLVERLAAPEWRWPVSHATLSIAAPRGVGLELQDLVRKSAAPLQPGDTICTQIKRASRQLGFAKPNWRVREAWYGGAGGWPAHVVDDFRFRFASLLTLALAHGDPR